MAEATCLMITVGLESLPAMDTSLRASGKLLERALRVARSPQPEADLFTISKADTSYPILAAQDLATSYNG
jgi:hypothetical protein